MSFNPNIINQSVCFTKPMIDYEILADSNTSRISFFYFSTSSSMSNHVSGKISQLSQTSDSMIPTSRITPSPLSALEQTSPRNSALYQPSPYTTPVKKEPVENKQVGSCFQNKKRKVLQIFLRLKYLCIARLHFAWALG